MTYCLEPSVILMIFFTPHVLRTYITVLSPKEEFHDSNSHFVDASHSVKQQNPAGTYWQVIIEPSAVEPRHGSHVPAVTRWLAYRLHFFPLCSPSFCLFKSNLKIGQGTLRLSHHCSNAPANYAVFRLNWCKLWFVSSQYIQLTCWDPVPVVLTQDQTSASSFKL